MTERKKVAIYARELPIYPGDEVLGIYSQPLTAKAGELVPAQPPDEGGRDDRPVDSGPGKEGTLKILRKQRFQSCNPIPSVVKETVSPTSRSALTTTIIAERRIGRFLYGLKPIASTPYIW